MCACSFGHFIYVAILPRPGERVVDPVCCSLRLSQTHALLSERRFRDNASSLQRQAHNL